MSAHKKTPSVRAQGVSGNVINDQENNVMANISTATSNVIPFDFRGYSVRTVMVRGEPWFVAADISSLLEYRDSFNMCRNLDADEKGTHSVSTLGGAQQMLAINESGLYAAILRSKKKEARTFRKWVTAEVLPSLRKHGQFIDPFYAMGDLVGSVIGTSGEHVLDRVIEQKASPVPHSLQRSFKHTMKSRLRSRFNVPRTALIPAEYLNDACNFVAAYSLEGEWIGRASLNTHELTDKELYDVGFLIHHFLAVKGIYERWGVGSALRMLGSPIPAEITDHFSDAMMAIGGLKKRSADMDVAANRLGLRNGKATRSAAA